MPTRPVPGRGPGRWSPSRGSAAPRRGRPPPPAARSRSLQPVAGDDLATVGSAATAAVVRSSSPISCPFDRGAAVTTTGAGARHRREQGGGPGHRQHDDAHRDGDQFGVDGRAPTARDRGATAGTVRPGVVGGVVAWWWSSERSGSRRRGRVGGGGEGVGAGGVDERVVAVDPDHGDRVVGGGRRGSVTSRCTVVGASGAQSRRCASR